MSNKTLEQKIILLYSEENKSTYEIAELLNTYPNKIRRTLKKHGVSLKSKSEAQKLALESGRCQHPTEGKKRSLEERVKISDGLISHWDSISEEEKEKRAKQAKDRWNKMSASQKDRMSQLATAAIRKAGKEGSKLEKFIGKKVQEAGYRVEFHNKRLIPMENLEIDIYIPELKTIIEVDGPSHFLPIWGEDKLQKQIKADLHKSGLILSRGFAIIRVKSMGQEALSKKERLSSDVVSHLNLIKKVFPPKTERFIEVE
jgi:very-short-patch-repair endonuclease/DNA-binding CsgD family transcriptional regulator